MKCGEWEDSLCREVFLFRINFGTSMVSYIFMQRLSLINCPFWSFQVSLYMPSPTWLPTLLILVVFLTDRNSEVGSGGSVSVAGSGWLRIFQTGFQGKEREWFHAASHGRPTLW